MNTTPDDLLFDRDKWLRYRLDRVYGSRKKADSALKRVEEAIQGAYRALDNWEENVRLLEKEWPKAEARDERRFAQTNKKLEKRVEELEAQLDVESKAYSSVEFEAIAKARTIAIFESILFAIENWATDDAPAFDFTSVAQAVIFKAVYDPIMSGVTDYYLDKVPFAAAEVVKRGREYVKSLRFESQTPLTDPSMRLTAQEYQSWWINDSLALLYGDRDPDWETIKPHTLEEMALWKSTDMDKNMNFPKIFDAFELTRKYGDEIRESSGLPDFTKQIMQTRLTAHE